MDVTKAPEGITGHVIDSGRDKKRGERTFSVVKITLQTALGIETFDLHISAGKFLSSVWAGAKSPNTRASRKTFDGEGWVPRFGTKEIVPRWRLRLEASPFTVPVHSAQKNRRIRIYGLRLCTISTEATIHL